MLRRILLPYIIKEEQITKADWDTCENVSYVHPKMDANMNWTTTEATKVYTNTYRIG